MTGITTLKARHYKPLIGFLTETIDRSFEKENKLAAAVAARQVCDHGKLAALRQRREVAYRVLENVLEYVLIDIRERQSLASDEPQLIETEDLPDSFLDKVFPNDDAGWDLRRRFKSALVGHAD